ncbi:hypothetical protein YPPY13_2986 [Yersinia pestis PY-13]|uniref:Uncharacterized protein n=3 Tax=Yersinia pseudotuberculosis complex TaxID=1649845 RepID=A0A0U1QYJ0_YERP3|nr:hypothetical protein YpsIP31758_1439 [Yersinia pseudotuberculosis IP 31758]ADV98159.1 hypothetical protein YPC_1541 [Yersinia pestis biovar Medievalis str. Harbin 35]EDR33057.1 hypothetical protein YPIP275_0933 [Yersinia pestis biovar Orientalis str. IP275]EDR49439.1 hypothetical protein YpB42003004_0106 [Yersinia pestis biovar Antiqua str. B42003004]EDR55788.1 hypothetical protein YpMG051020_0003 [Yersinia pestis biovar Orientalis str. MG05-1020]EEO76221.1 hypothetical protein YP516_2418 [
MHAINHGIQFAYIKSLSNRFQDTERRQLDGTQERTQVSN